MQGYTQCTSSQYLCRQCMLAHSCPCPAGPDAPGKDAERGRDPEPEHDREGGAGRGQPMRPCVMAWRRGAVCSGGATHLKSQSVAEEALVWWHEHGPRSCLEQGWEGSLRAQRAGA